MKKNRFKVKFLSILCLLPMLVFMKANGGWDIGDGGDQAKLIFEKGRNDAAAMLRAFNLNAPSTPVDESILTFLKQPFESSTLRDAMVKDVGTSPYLWIPGDGRNGTPIQQLCAMTNLPDLGNTIRFALLACENHLKLPGEGETSAVALILHETVHHFGLDDSPKNDAFASQVALAVLAEWRERSAHLTTRWSEVPLSDSPDPRYQHTAVWAPSEPIASEAGRVLVWGGCNYSILPNRENCANHLNSGGQLVFKSEFDDTPEWLSISSENAPSPRQNHTAVWARNESLDGMIIYGGCSGEDARCDLLKADGGIYNPKTDTWQKLPEQNAPSARMFHSSTWTGREMIVWGGVIPVANGAPAATSSGSRLVTDAQTGRIAWSAISTENSPSPRFGHAALWTGKEMIVWGGCERQGIVRCARPLNDGRIYNPETNRWRVMRPISSGMERTDFSAVWTGRGMMIWGGKNSAGILSSGAYYDLESDRWTVLPTMLPGGESGRFSHSAVWDSKFSRMIIWGGESSDGRFPQTALLFTAGLNEGGGSWSLLQTDVNPIGRKGHGSVWTGSRMIIWGGFGADETFLSTGGILRVGR